jgi:hypothetical protein
MKQKLQSQRIVLATLFRDEAPKILDHIERAYTDTGQAIVWLVGLASTLLVLAVASPDKVTSIARTHYVLLCSLLLATIGSGVLYRVLSLVALSYSRGLMLQFRTHMAGYVAASDGERLEHLSDKWDEQEIVRRLRDDLGSDYGFLLDHHVPLEGCRAAYQSAYDLWKRQETEGVVAVMAVAAAFFGLTPNKGGTVFQGTPIESIRKKAYFCRILEIAAGGLVVIASACFLAAMSIVASGLMGLAST